MQDVVKAVASFGGRHLSALVSSLVVVPAFLYLGLPVLVLIIIFSGALATAHPWAIVVLPLGIGVCFAWWGHEVTPLSLMARGGLLAVSILLALLAWSLGQIDCPETGCTEEHFYERFWSEVAPGPFLVLAVLSGFAALTGSQRINLVFIGTVAVLVAESALVLAVFLVVWAFALSS